MSAIAREKEDAYLKPLADGGHLRPDLLILLNPVGQAPRVDEKLVELLGGAVDIVQRLLRQWFARVCSGRERGIGLNAADACNRRYQFPLTKTVILIVTVWLRRLIITQGVAEVYVHFRFWNSPRDMAS